MRRRVLLALTGLCIMLAGGCTSLESGRPADEMLVIGHRGSPGYGAENTIAGFRRAIEMGADGVELDLVLTADGRLAVLHDWTLNRLVGEPQLRSAYPDRAVETERGPLWRTRDFTMAELERLVITQRGPQTDSISEEHGSSELSICSYERVLEVFSALRRVNPRLKLYTEIKTSPSHMTAADVEQTAGLVLDALIVTGEIDHPENHWLQSFDGRVMKSLATMTELAAFDKALLLCCEPGIRTSANPVVLDTALIHTETDLERFLTTEVVHRGMTMVHGWKLMWWHLLEVKGIDCAKVAHKLGLQIHAFTFRDERFRSDYQNRPVLAPKAVPFRSAEEEVMYFMDRGFDAVMSDTISSARAAAGTATASGGG